MNDLTCEYCGTPLSGEEVEDSELTGYEICCDCLWIFEYEYEDQ